MDQQQIAAAIVSLFESSGMSQAGLARLLDVDRSYVSHVVHGRRDLARVETLVAWLDELGGELVVTKKGAGVMPVPGEVEPLVRLAGSLTAEQLELVVRLASVLPRMTDREQEYAAVLVGMWEGEAVDRDLLDDGERTVG